MGVGGLSGLAGDLRAGDLSGVHVDHGVELEMVHSRAGAVGVDPFTDTAYVCACDDEGHTVDVVRADEAGSDQESHGLGEIEGWDSCRCPALDLHDARLLPVDPAVDDVPTDSGDACCGVDRPLREHGVHAVVCEIDKLVLSTNEYRRDATRIREEPGHFSLGVNLPASAAAERMAALASERTLGPPHSSM